MEEINPVLIDLPEEITTERLLLRCPRIGEGAPVLDGIRASLKELQPWMPWAKDDYALADAEMWCRRSLAKTAMRDEVQFIIREKGSESSLGSIGLFRMNWNVPSCEVGYWLRSDKVGNGYMSEALRAVTDLARERLKMVRITLQCDERNLRSAAVAERCGFQREGLLRCDGRDPSGALRSTYLFAKVFTDAPRQ